jgi:hypothetical protein
MGILPHPAESRNYKIRFGDSSFLSVESSVKDAFMHFKNDFSYSKTTDAMNRLLKDGLILRGYLPSNNVRQGTRMAEIESAAQIANKDYYTMLAECAKVGATIYLSGHCWPGSLAKQAGIDAGQDATPARIAG